jgi:hypothetical protein
MSHNQRRAAPASKALRIVEGDDFRTKLPDHVKNGIEKSLEQAKNGQTKTFEEVKTY